MAMVPEIDWQDVLNFMQKGACVVNILSRQAYDNLHIKGSVWIPFDRLESDGWMELSGKVVITYCASMDCGASVTAAQILRDHGIEAYAYRGGIREWSDLGLAVEGKLTPANYEKAGKC